MNQKLTQLSNEYFVTDKKTSLKHKMRDEETGKISNYN